MRKPGFCICKNKDADQLRGNTAKLISPFVFATLIVKYLSYLNPKFQAFRHIQYLHSRFVSDLVGNPEDRFSRNEAQMFFSVQRTSSGPTPDKKSTKKSSGLALWIKLLLVIVVAVLVYLVIINMNPSAQNKIPMSLEEDV